ncbi:protein glxC, partial [Mycobacterium sp. ITM-2017-0098]
MTADERSREEKFSADERSSALNFSSRERSSAVIFDLQTTSLRELNTALHAPDLSG